MQWQLTAFLIKSLKTNKTEGVMLAKRTKNKTPIAHKAKQINDRTPRLDISHWNKLLFRGEKHLPQYNLHGKLDMKTTFHLMRLAKNTLKLVVFSHRAWSINGPLMYQSWLRELFSKHQNHTVAAIHAVGLSEGTAVFRCCLWALLREQLCAVGESWSRV